MSERQSTDLPLWVQDRDRVISEENNVEWRYQTPPDYSRQNRSFQREKKYNHPEGSLEAIVENLVRTFEMEASYKKNPQQWLSIVADRFELRTNGKKISSAEELSHRGTYNLFIEQTEHYNPDEETFESSGELFHSAFPDGFLWEVIEVLSGPPKVMFKWRHWGTFSGPYKEYAPTGETVEICGVTIAEVTEDLKIVSMEHFFDNSAFLSDLTKGCPFHENGNS
ncbi:MAG: ester cyclase [Prochloraceae cyanobacterium]